MFYVWQMNDGRWHVSAYTSAPRSARALAHRIAGSETKAEAEAKAREANATWADVRRAELAATPTDCREYDWKRG